MATTDDLVLLDRAVSNYHKAELFPAELGEPSEHTPSSWFGRGIRTFRCEMIDYRLAANGAMATAVSGGLTHTTSGDVLSSHPASELTGQSPLPLLAPDSPPPFVICHVSLCTLIISPSPSGLRSLP
jgi:hypothetical protein